MNRKNKWHLPVIVIVALTAIFLLNYFNSKKPPAEQIQQLISQHRAAIIFVKSNTEKDTEFLDALKEARHKMRGKGRIVFADEDFLKASEFQSDAGLGGVRGKESAFPRGVTGSDSDRQRGVSPY
ncbi:MAG: hypothetical protein NC932_01350, partial [Candidatus Omnitrophica bacterium]|nr:hypothetical protein [Candidatus Omnitrophota bacterium]